MHYKNTIEAVYIQLDEIQQVVAKIGSDGNIYSIDVDLVLEKTRHVYDLMLALRGESTSSKIPPAKIIENDKEVKTSPKLTDEKISFKVVEPKTKVDKLIDSKEIENDKEEAIKPTEKPPVKTSKTEQTSGSKKFLVETFQKTQPSINEELSQQVPKTDIVSHLKLKPISSLTSEIGINEKFELIQNLFNGDKTKYEQTIHILNTFHEYNEAAHYITDNFNWDTENSYVQRILELLKRKHLTGRNEK